MITSDEGTRATFRANGYAVLPGVVDSAWRRRLRARAAAIVAAFDPDAHRCVFSTRDDAQARDDYFLASASAVRCFLEEDAVDDHGRLVVPSHRAINKIGHALHRLDPDFAAFSGALGLRGAAAALGLAEPRAVQSMYLFKQPRIGAEVRVHQDATFLYTEPSSVLGFWFALEDADEDNGCLWAVPGGHRRGLARRWRRTAQGLVFDELAPPAWTEADAVPLPVEAGSLVLLHGLLPHFSRPNRSGRSREAYSVHVVDGTAAWASDNWLAGPDV